MRPAMVACTLALTVAGCGYYWLPGKGVVNFAGKHGDPLSESELEERIRVPPGFSINTYWGGIENPRMLRFTERGDLLVSSPKQGRVLVVERDAGGDGRGDGVRTLLESLHRPHGLTLHDGWLYVAETDAVLRVAFDSSTARVTGAPQRIVSLPGGRQHWTRTIAFGPDGLLYVSVGSTCDACVERDPRRAAILRYRPDGTGEEVYATGLRNSVGLAWQPRTGHLYATENGRDRLGDDFPPDELNRIEAGGFYGWPFAHGNRVPDPALGDRAAELVARSLPPAHEIGPHVAALGIVFYEGTRFPPPYRDAAFVACHGSYNRRRKIGYEVRALLFAPDGSIRGEKFVSGFELDEDVVGRPVDVTVGPDEALYVSDDFTGSIYRVAWNGAARD